METNTEPTYLYHYTTAEGLKGIVEKQEIWATNILYLNDWMELWHGRSKLSEALEKRLASMKDNTEEKKVGREVLEQLKEANPPSSSSVFVSSFSYAEEGDDLSQWRAYCRDGGYSIGFRRERLASLTNSHPCVRPAESHKCSRNNLYLEPCRYIGDCEGHIDRLLAYVARVRKTETADISTQVAELSLGAFAAVYKHPGFKCECEWRLICARTKPAQKFRTRGAFQIPYVTICIHDQALWSDVQIVVGPSSRENAKLKEESVKMLIETELEKHKLPIDCIGNIRTSGIPYRPTMGG